MKGIYTILVLASVPSRGHCYFPEAFSKKDKTHARNEKRYETREQETETEGKRQSNKGEQEQGSKKKKPGTYGDR
eukprot:1140670-Pelagomonas_calceolata.AAC.1